MPSLRRTLPALGHLEIFETAARLGSFTRAGAELGLTQAAVSYAVRGLEADLGTPLFTRRHRDVVLTPAGATLYADVALGLGHIRRSIETVRRSRPSRQVTLSVSNSTAVYFILPRLAEFRARHPEIDLLVKSTDRDLDIEAEDITLGVRYGAGVLPRYRRAPIARETIYPVCSPAYLRAIGGEAGIEPARLAELQLIHLAEPYRPCPTWADWFAAEGLPPPVAGRPGLALSDYGLVVQAALEGQGVALGWEHIVDDLVRRGALVRPTDRVWRTGTDYFVVWCGPLGEHGGIVRDWLIAEAARRNDAGTALWSRALD